MELPPAPPAVGSGASARPAGTPVTVFTDGACLGNPGPGAWAWALSPERYAVGVSPDTTNQRMELTAVLEALSALPGPLEVVSDSTYVVNCFRDRWWSGWRARRWKSSRGEPVANQDLWRPLVEEVVDRRGGEVRFRWVKGHAGDPMNTLVDRLANEAARTQRPPVPAPVEPQAPAGLAAVAGAARRTPAPPRGNS